MTVLRHSEAGPAGADGVVLLHGWSCSRAQWEHQFISLAKSYRTIAVDLPGHGENPVAGRTVPPTIEAFSDSVHALIEAQLGDVPVILVGHSLGSVIAVEVAHRLGRRAGLVIALDGLVYLDVYERQDEAEIDRFLAPFTGDYHNSVLDYLDGMVLARDRLDRRTLARTCSDLGRDFGLALYRATLRWDMEAALAASGVPITVLCASATVDTDAYVKYGTRLDIIPLAGVGHFPQMEAPEVVTPILLGLLETWRHRPWTR